jgi:hypothetical protein
MYQQMRSNHGRTQVEEMMNPITGARATGKNFQKDNMKQIREKEDQFRQKN